MAEYIEREALMRRIKEIHCAECDSYHGVRCRACWVDDTLDYIDSEPAADVEKMSDGYHTFADLYEQRLILSAALAKNNPHAWKSKRHEDGSVPFGGGWFIMGFDTDEGCYTYHYELKDWDLFQCKELSKGKPWDGHTSKDVRRLLSIPSADVAPVRWQPVFWYEGLYEVNQFGQIRNKDGQIMRQRLKKAKYTVYKKVRLYKNGKYKHLYVHRIVAQAFIPNPQGFDLINHKDEDGTNNFVDNLEWCDRSYNATYGTSPKKISKAFKGRESEKRIAVYATNKSGDFVGEWDSITEAAKDVGCSTSEISGALKGKRKTVKGLIWNYCPYCSAKMAGGADNGC